MIKKADFLNWYFEEADITDYVKQSLLKHGTFSIQVHELFEEVGFLPYRIVCNPWEIDELDLGSNEIDLEKYNVELI